MKIKILILCICSLFSIIAFSDSDNIFYEYYNGKYLKALEKLSKFENNEKGLFYYGKMYLNGYGVERNQNKAIQLISFSAEKGYLPAQMFLGKYYFQKQNDPKKAFYWFEKAADKNNVAAQMFCAAAYLYGYGTKKSSRKTRKYIIKAAKNGNPIAQYTLAIYFLNSRYKKDRKLGWLWLMKSVEQKNPKAQYKLGKMYLLGEYVSKDQTKALKWLTKAANNDIIPAIYLLGEYYQNLGNLTEAFKWYQKAAKKNYSDAQLQLGKIYLSSDKNFHDEKKGFLLILRAAEQDNVSAYKQLAKMYENGIGVKKNIGLAKQWRLKVKNNTNKKTENNKNAKQLVIQWLTNGKNKNTNMENYTLSGILFDWKNTNRIKEGVFNMSPKLAAVKQSRIFSQNFSITHPDEVKISDFIKIIGVLRYQKKNTHLFIPRYQLPKLKQYSTLFDTLSNRGIYGYPKVQFMLGQMYELGLGTHKNLNKAIQWYLKSAAQNYSKAEYNLGILYLKGRGVEKNYQIALNWLEKSAFKGNVFAQFLLGSLYEYGFMDEVGRNIIPKDIQYAEKMYSFSALNGYGIAQLNLADLYLSRLLTQKNNHQLIYELYENAAKQRVKAAAFPLACYYAETVKEKEIQQWAFSVINYEANKGNILAAFMLGVMYDRGLGVDKNKKEAIHWYQKAVEKNISVAQFVLGTYYYLGEGVFKNQEKGIQLLTQAAKKDLPYANYNLAVFKYKQNENSEAFLRFLQKASEQHYNKASLVLADYYLLHLNSYEYLKEAVEIYQKMAKRKNALAQLKLGYMYEHGIYFDKNFKIAESWYSKAALQNIPLAQYLLANLYRLGKLGEPDIEKAKFWYKKAVKQGFTPATIALGFIAENIEHNYKKALYWYRRAAEVNNPIGQFNLALMYEYGKGIDVDYADAFKWYFKAASSGFAPAQYGLATMYLEGQGVWVNHRKARRWYEKAAEQGDAFAQYQLAQMYENGIGVRKDLSKAKILYKQSMLNGNSQAKIRLNQLGSSDKAVR